MTEIGSNLARLLKEKGWSSKRLAEASGVSPTTIGNILHDKKSPTLSTLSLICTALNVELYELVAPKELSIREVHLDEQTRTAITAQMRASVQCPHTCPCQCPHMQECVEKYMHDICLKLVQERPS